MHVQSTTTLLCALAHAGQVVTSPIYEALYRVHEAVIFAYRQSNYSTLKKLQHDIGQYRIIILNLYVMQIQTPDLDQIQFRQSIDQCLSKECCRPSQRGCPSRGCQACMASRGALHVELSRFILLVHVIYMFIERILLLKRYLGTGSHMFEPKHR